MIAVDYNGYLTFREGLFEALDDGLYTAEWLDGMVWAGIIRVIAGDDAAIMFKIKGYPTGARVLCGVGSTGNLDTIVNSLIPQAEDFARDMGCISARISSRPGWVKALKDSGYSLYKTTIRKGL